MGRDDPPPPTLLQRLQYNDPTLKELGGFGGYSLDEIASALVSNVNISSFKLSSCGLDDERCTKLMQSLGARQQNRQTRCNRCQPNVQRMSLARNYIRADGARAIAEFIASTSMQPDQLGGEGGRRFNSKSSRSMCSICGDSVPTPQQRICNNNAIRLDLLQNNIRDDGAISIADAIAASVKSGKDTTTTSSSSIVELGMEGNGIGDRGLFSVANMMKTNTTIHTLRLGKNYCISSGGVLLLSQALKVNNTLEVLSLTANLGIGDLGAKYLGEALRYNRTVKTLLLTKCGISDVGGMYILNALYCDESPEEVLEKSNHTLTEVSLCCNVKYCSGNLTLRELLGWNKQGAAFARRSKLGFFLRSVEGTLHVYSLDLDRRLFPALLYKLWRISPQSKKNTSGDDGFGFNVDVLLRFLCGMPELLEAKKPLVEKKQIRVSES